MPKRFASRAQARLFHAAAQGDTDVIPRSVAKKVVKETAGKPIKKLPLHVKPKKGK